MPLPKCCRKSNGSCLRKLLLHGKNYTFFPIHLATYCKQQQHCRRIFDKNNDLKKFHPRMTPKTTKLQNAQIIVGKYFDMFHHVQNNADVELLIRYLGVFIVRSRLFKCSLDHAKKSFYRSANAIFGKVGRLASEEV